MVKAKKWLGVFLIVFTCMSMMLNSVPARAKLQAKVNPKLIIVSQPKPEYNTGDRVIVKFNSPNYMGIVQYRAFLWNCDTGKVEQEIYKDYYRSGYFYKPVCVGKSIFTIDVLYPQKPGNYYLALYVKPNGAKTFTSYAYTSKFTVKEKVADEKIYSLVIDQPNQIYGSADVNNKINIDGNVYIIARNAKLRNANVKGKIIIDSGIDSNAYLENVTAADIQVMSGGEKNIRGANLKSNNFKFDLLIAAAENSIDFNNVQSKTLTLSQNNKALIIISGNTNIEKTIVYTSATLENKDSSFGNVEILGRKDRIANMILKGKFDNILVKNAASISVDKDSEVSKLDLSLENMNECVKLEGSFKEVSVNKEGKLDLGGNTAIETMRVNANVEINTQKTSKVNKVENKNYTVKVIGEGKNNIKIDTNTNTNDNTNTGNHNNGGGTYTPPQPPARVSVTGVKLSVNIKELRIGDEFRLKVTIEPANASNKEVFWTSSDPEVVRVEDGLLTALKEGTAVITAITEDGGHKATANITVKAADTSSLGCEYKVEDNKITITVKNSVDDEATICIYDENNNLKYVDQMELKDGIPAVFESILNDGEYRAVITSVEEGAKEILFVIK